MTVSRCDVRIAATTPDVLTSGLRELLDLINVPDLFGAGSHLETSDGVIVSVNPPLTHTGNSTIGIVSGLPEQAHNEWAFRIFDAVCEIIPGAVALLDENDTILRSRRYAAA